MTDVPDIRSLAQLREDWTGGQPLNIKMLNLIETLMGSSMTKGAGVSAMETYISGVSRAGDLWQTRIVLDLTGLVASTTDLDIIGNTGGAASAHFGQITKEVNGTIQAVRLSCLEVPAGGPDDIDFYVATESTGAQDDLVTGLTERVLITSGAAWTLGRTLGTVNVPANGEYLYLVNGEAGVPGTFTAGKFLIELFGLAP